MNEKHTWTTPDVVQYKGIEVNVPPGDDAAFAEAVRQEAIGRFDADIPTETVERKLEAMTAQEKLRINQDAIYHILADITFILTAAYRETGVTRPAAQVRSEAMDIMLQTFSLDREEPSTGYFYQLLKSMVTQYRTLPEQFDEKLDSIVEKRKKKTESMAPEERANEAFNAYLGSLDLVEEQWKARNFQKAVQMAKYDLLLDVVADKEQIKAAPEEIEQKYRTISDDCGIDVSVVKTKINSDMLAWEIKREKADKLIIGSAIRKA
jgi:FKBP-type peptidyl-prolyl cis-trans isomerase (trigger factor)